MPHLPVQIVGNDADGDGYDYQDECDDDDASVNPAAAEICNDGIDNNCDGDQDCDDSTCSSDLACTASCVDADSDGEEDDACGGDDCDDTDAAIKPGATENCTDMTDNDCDGATDCSDSDCSADVACVCADGDSDGHADDGCGGDDCDDSDASNYPTHGEDCSDGHDNDCDGDVDCDDSNCSADLACTCPDVDADGYPDASCTGVAGDDCDDGDAAINPGVTEGTPALCDNSIDEDCDGSDFSCSQLDEDHDFSVAQDDCDDNDAGNYPANTENCTDASDNDCDNDIDCSDSDCATDPACCVDSDADGYGDISCGGDDCDDSESDINPGENDYGGAFATDGIDQDCSGTPDDGPDDPCEIDTDGDGYDTCYPGNPTLYDCNNNNISINPVGTEDCSDHLDNDCNGLTDCSDTACSAEIVCTCDLDRDGHLDTGGGCGGDDCDDSDAANYPGHAETCNDGTDNDCDGLNNCNDSDCSANAACTTDSDGDGTMNGMDDCIDRSVNGHDYSMCGMLYKIDYDDATTACANKGAALAIYSTLAEYNAVNTAFSALPISPSNHYWLNGMDAGHEEVWLTSFNGRLTYTPWQSGGMTGVGGGGGSQNCLVGYSYNVQIYDLQCEFELAYMCEKNLNSDNDGDGVVDGSDNCPYVYNPDQTDNEPNGTGEACEATPFDATRSFQVGGQIWAYYGGVTRDFSGARNYCIAKGGHLATIASSTEEGYLYYLQPADWTYIGLTDIDEEGTFEWVTGEPNTYRHWPASQPDNGNGGAGQDACVLNYPTHQWDDMWTNQVRPFLCEFGDGEEDDLSIGTTPDGVDTCQGEDDC
ncbi:hypothetical protein K2X33_06025 [bacterium]|nr:hypothetical protein [bacterium]